MKKLLLLSSILACFSSMLVAATITLNSKGGKLTFKDGKAVGTVVVTTTTTTTIPAYPTNGLIAAYLLNGSKKDEVSGLDGEWLGAEYYLNNVPSRLSGYQTNSGGFFDSGSYYLRTVNSTLTHGKAALTVAFWFKTAEFERIGVWTGGESDPYGGGFVVGTSAHGTEILQSGGLSSGFWSGTWDSLNTWNHITVTITNTVMRGYTNGVYREFGGGGVQGGTMVQDKQWVIGVYYPMGTVEGGIAQFLVYDRVLTSNEIHDLALGP